ncbi:pyruvate dehydrogenase [acetyl-transferring]-phosphatase 2, mitochondrial-like [Anguilla anguilla]|uniref:pyruvate dehydrogenase [acetyl-transferring]-phosphatase 2, mitochondrial-like n=1 Tax=Anguilla anguilla TaxID=7936 RepID=UPI0015A7ED8D|nr:pyruvate dehydrogenase [acetyl-transferring]-phosphatase 2, mitochondrial-like [Anguilla anguilla]XP_035272795.1 pyruvate dehydrogenase [acetyl-transferring]-phosphatase 2, mitochondrial-like [Anguilla anguilla]
MSAAVSSWVVHWSRSQRSLLPGRGRGLPPWPPKRAWFSVDSRPSGGLTPQGRRRLSTGEDPDFQLSDAQVNAVLRANEQAVRFSESDARGPAGPVLGFESNQLAANSPGEDRRSAVTCLLTRGAMFGVFDGHCGYACAQTVSERLLYYAAVALMPRPRLEELEGAMAELRPVSPVLQWHKHHNDYNYRASTSLYLKHLRAFWRELLAEQEPRGGEGLGPRDALDRAFRRLDADISREAQVPLESAPMRSAALEAAFSGSTACVAYVDAEGVHVANAGDCRAVLGVRGEDGGWSALPLSHDHNALNGAELARVRARHPDSERATVVADDRLLGTLMPLRAFGDVRFKWSLELQRKVLENSRDLDSLDIYEYTPPNYLTPPYLEATPELTYHRLRAGDRFLILASDGLWDMLDSEGAVRLVGERLTASGHQEAPPAPVLDSNSATHLIRHAIGTNEYGEVDPERLAAMLALPEEVARMYRDDITVTIVYFSHVKHRDG